MDKQEAVEKLLKNPIINEIHSNLEFKTYGNNVTLVGGAIVDILEGRTPKDYDFLSTEKGLLRETLGKIGYKYNHESKTAITYSRGTDIVQILKTDIDDFEYTISQSRLMFKKDKSSLIIDEESFENKVLIPIEFDRAFQATRCLLRKPHWERKGYTLPEETYYSLINLIQKSKNKMHS